MSVLYLAVHTMWCNACGVQKGARDLQELELQIVSHPVDTGK